MPARRGQDEKAQKSHIPRPPNAFILFRSSFIRNEHVPGKVEGNHSTLSKIIGLCWKDLSPQERRVWEEKAREAQAEHRKQYPDWRWTPEANALGKKRVRKSRKQQDDVESSSQEDPDPSLSKPKPDRKSKAKDKGKARERSHDHVEVDEDVRVAKIADLLKQGKTGSELQTALEEWKATLDPADSRPSKKRRTGRKRASASTSRTLPELSPRDSFPSSSPTDPPPSPSLQGVPDPPHVLRRSPSDNPELTRIPTQSASLISHDPSHTPSHTPSPTVPLYASSTTVPANQTTLPWPDNTPATSYSTSQPPYPSWWPSSPSATPSSPFAPCYEPPEITTDGLGYEEGNNFDREYSEQFGPLLLSPPHDDTEGAQWSRNAGRNGLCAVIADPLSGCDEDCPPTASSATFPPPVNVAPSPILSAINPQALRHSPTTTTFIPSSTYSSLTGWAGEYDPAGPSTVLGDWFNPNWQASVRVSPPWGQENDTPDNPHSNAQALPTKIPYQNHHQTSLRLQVQSSPSAADVHQLDSPNPPSSITP
ncbi:transcriptional regulator family: HMG [Agaricus bisporus var. burnettii]|uniref:Transcriptional regulator family: HMG n=1 Tax=Agaricus bisporus var. burnettii TaxID=192524 RepID=A0A8H7C7J0_AGABI|nr:transcriptional regulator family: HMG [Agaricus bisporus var. burnettii]